MNDKEPILTVIMPVYNASKYLTESVNSILNQTYTNFKMIIVDDGSTDNSLSIIKRLASKDNRIKVFTKKNSGVVDTLNYAIGKCDTELIARMDADDIALESRLEKQVNYLSNNRDCVALGCQIKMFSDKDSDLGIDPRPTRDINLRLFLGYGCAIPGPTIMMRRNVINNIGGFRNETKGLAEDYDVWSRIATRSIKFKLANLPEILQHSRMSPKGISNTNRYQQYEMTVKVGTEHRKKLIESGYYNFVSPKKHLAWLRDREHISDSFHREDMMRIYYTVQNWYLNDMYKYSRSKCYINRLLLATNTLIFNPKDLGRLINQSRGHQSPS